MSPIDARTARSCPAPLANGTASQPVAAVPNPATRLSLALLMRLVQGTDWKDRGAAARAVLGIVLLLGHLAAGIYCLYRARDGGYYWFYF